MRHVILDALQRGYGDATVTPLDRKVAEDIESALMPYFAMFIAAAGGSVEIPERELIDPPQRVVYRHETFGFTVKYSTRDLDTGEEEA